jgi:ubiquitin
MVMGYVLILFYSSVMLIGKGPSEVKITTSPIQESSRSQKSILGRLTSAFTKSTVTPEQKRELKKQQLIEKYHDDIVKTRAEFFVTPHNKDLLGDIIKSKKIV